jgi:ATPase subunit of ABC transporter with duplicated ATPase domains
MDIIELEQEKPRPEFHFLTARTPGRVLFEANDLVIGYEEPLSKPIHFLMERKQRIILKGANGIGKTTLLRSLLGLIEPLAGTVERDDYLNIGYYEQEVSPKNDHTCLQEIWDAFPSWSQYECRCALAKCGLTSKHIESSVKVLSGGEQAKVRLCKLMNVPSNILVLDEPTNHLDIDAKEELKKALAEYTGSILMVCHEPEFYEGLADEVIDCTEWTTKII